ncbi:MAG: ABC transporter permease subunit [Treponema sp.]|jgi:putative spermidine/putrescine transport system permease protein|nr:ABC transporter permease subunit [Treponema sp.]
MENAVVQKKRPGRAVLKAIGRYWPALPFAVLVAMFELVPLISMIIRSFTKEYGSSFTLDNYVSGIFMRPIYLASIKNTLQVSLLSAAIGMAVVFAAAALLANAKNRLRRSYMTLLTITSNFAGMPLAFAFMSVLGTSGVFVLISKNLNFAPLASFDLYTKTGLLLTYVYFQIPLGTLLMLPAFEAIRPEWKESAALLEAGPAYFWWKVGIPVMMPAIAGTFSMLFANAVSAYATPYMLIPGHPLMSLSIAGMFVGENRPRPGLGSAFSIIMLLIILAMIGLSNLVKRIYTKGGGR